MDYFQTKQLDLLMALAYPLKGNAYIYNYILKTVDALVEIPPPVGKGQILDLICKIFKDPKYESEKNRIIQIVTGLNKSKGTKIIKAIELIAMFRPNNTSLINPMYTKLSNSLDLVPSQYLDSLIETIGKMQEKISFILNSIDVKQILDLVKKLMSSFNLKDIQKNVGSLFSKENMDGSMKAIKSLKLMDYLKKNKTGGVLSKKNRKSRHTRHARQRRKTKESRKNNKSKKTRKHTSRKNRKTKRNIK